MQQTNRLSTWKSITYHVQIVHTHVIVHNVNAYKPLMLPAVTPPI